MSYESFISGKLTSVPPTGLDDSSVTISEPLFPFQASLVRWAMRRGRAAIFADCGLGKSLMELEWARHVAAHTGKRVLILTPLAVASQTVREAERFGIRATRLRTPIETEERVVVTNYERLHLFDASEYGGVVLDESSILKSFDGKTRTTLIDRFANTPFKLCATATPAPNDHQELGNHSEFLGVKPRVEMLAEYFVHDTSDTGTWRLKGHARGAFWKWVASWAAAVRKPSDLGFSDEGYELPPLRIEEHVLESDMVEARAAGMLFALPARTLQEQRTARRASLSTRVQSVADLVNGEKGEQWLLWAELNDEGDALVDAIPGAVQVAGSDKPDDKEQRLLNFARGDTRVLVSKVKIAGFGMNLQTCARQAFVGATHSFEQFFQAIRRSHRFGQKRAVHVHVFSSQLEIEVLQNLRAKERATEQMMNAMVDAMRDTQMANVVGAKRETNNYNPAPIAMPSWI